MRRSECLLATLVCSVFWAPISAGAQALSGPGVFVPATCEMSAKGLMAGFTETDVTAYLDRPDADSVRATSAVETGLTLRLAREEVSAPLIKAYCQIGMTQMVVDYFHNVEDDAVRAVTVRTIYDWTTNDEMPGWQLTQIGERYHCARGTDPEALQCQ